MRIKSGNCVLCDVGVFTGHTNRMGQELHTGDIILLWNGRYVGTDMEEWYPETGLTAIVSDQYQSYSDGSVIEKDGEPQFFVMGVKDCGFDSPEWDFQIVKKYYDAIVGEHWETFGFNYVK